MVPEHSGGPVECGLVGHIVQQIPVDRVAILVGDRSARTPRRVVGHIGIGRCDQHRVRIDTVHHAPNAGDELGHRLCLRGKFVALCSGGRLSVQRDISLVVSVHIVEKDRVEATLGKQERDLIDHDLLPVRIGEIDQPPVVVGGCTLKKGRRGGGNGIEIVISRVTR